MAAEIADSAIRQQCLVNTGTVYAVHPGASISEVETLGQLLHSAGTREAAVIDSVVVEYRPIQQQTESKRDSLCH